MPLRAFCVCARVCVCVCILFDKLPHAPSAAIQRSTYTRTRRHRPGKVRLRTYAVMGETSTNHEARPTRRTGAMHHGVRAIDGCLLQLTCERRAARSHARYVHLDGERSLSARDRCDARIPDHLSPSLCAKEGTILSRDGCSIRQASRISRATQPRQRDAIVDLPRRSHSDAMRSSDVCGSTSSVASHSSLEERRDYRRSTSSEKRVLDNEASYD